MNLMRIRNATTEIERHAKALTWLQEYGVKISDPTGDVEIRPGFASSCVGAPEAAKVLSELADAQLPQLIQSAIKHCESEIDAWRNAIIEEVNE